MHKIFKSLPAICVSLILILTCSCKKNADTSTPCSASSTDMGSLYSDITTNTTLAAGTYHVTNSINIKNNATLTLSPGVTLIFSGGMGLSVNSGAAINAIGSASCPITFTGSTAAKGSWACVQMRGMNTLNQFENCIFQYGGDSALTASTTCAVLRGYGPSDPCYISLKNCQFKNNKGYGLFLSNAQDNLATFENCTFSGNDKGPCVCPEQVNKVSNTNTISGNSTDQVDIYFTINTRALSADATFNKIGVPYYLFYGYNGDGMLSPAGHKITVKAGVTLIMAPNTGLGNTGFVSTTNSVFDFAGTATDPIIIKGSNSSAGCWHSIQIRDQMGPNNFAYVHFSDGGNPFWSTDKGMIVVTGPEISTININNCSFANSNNYGVGLATHITGSIHSNVNGSTDTAQWRGLIEGVNTFRVINPNNIALTY